MRFSNKTLERFLGAAMGIASSLGLAGSAGAQDTILYETMPHPSQYCTQGFLVLPPFSGTVIASKHAHKIYDLSSFEPGNYAAVIESHDPKTQGAVTSTTLGRFRLNLVQPGYLRPDARQTASWNMSEDGGAEFYVRGGNVDFYIGKANFKKGDKIIFYKLEERVPIEKLPKESPKESYAVVPKQKEPTPAIVPRTKEEERQIEDYIRGAEYRLERGRKLINQLKGFVNPEDARKFDLQLLDYENNLNKFILDYLKSKIETPVDSKRQ